MAAKGLGRLEEARERFEDALGRLPATLGDDHPLTVETRRQLEAVRRSLER